MKTSCSLLALLAVAAGLAACTRPEEVPEPVRAVRTMAVATNAVGGSREFAAEIRARTEARLSFRVGAN